MKSLDTKNVTQCDWEGIDDKNPEKSTLPLCEMLKRFESLKKYSRGAEILTEYATLDRVQAQFYTTLSSQEAHILLGSLRAGYSPESFLLNPNNGSSGKPQHRLSDFFDLVNESYLFGAVIKAAYLTICLGLKPTTAHDIHAMILDDQIYPSLQWFKDFFQATHFEPVCAFC